jgi:hypothetical protein
VRRLLAALLLLGLVACVPALTRGTRTVTQLVELEATARMEVATNARIPEARKANLLASLDAAKQELDQALDLLSLAGSVQPDTSRIKSLAKSAEIRIDSVRQVTNF